VPESSGVCPLGDREQIRNLLLVGMNTGLCYLGAPVLYADVVHTSLCDSLGASTTVANLPAMAYLVMSAMPLFAAWLFPKVRSLKGIMVVCYGLLAVSGGVVAASLVLPLPNPLRVALVIGHGAVLGAARTTAVACEFEVLGRAVSESRRGPALSLAYGLGPIFAVAGSLASQLLLNKKVAIPGLGAMEISGWESPYNFATLFAASVPLMGLAALLAGRYLIPLPEEEPGRQQFLEGIFGGLGQFLAHRVAVRAAVIAIVVMSGLNGLSNMSLYTNEILGVPPADLAGYQNTWRYIFKGIAGIFFGWLLARTTPKALVSVTSVVGLAGLVWVLVTPPELFLLSFGLVGAGQLFGIYITNYILCCAPAAQMRRYMAFTMLAMVPVALTSPLFGRIVDHYSLTDRAFGFQLSFAVAVGFFVIGIVLTLFLPARPRPEERTLS
jgi:MFS family permease